MRVLQVFDDNLRLGRDFVTAKAHVIEEVGEHTLGSSDFAAAADAERTKRHQLHQQRLDSQARHLHGH
ncbi:hypothetical protein GCM10011374_36350 [Kocuria dechangensis]|uniref:Uncharacterized protein n=1 Tax=Kocuria dechangensis TaxID=1176249 RepID=A0A917H695_9MICC|nr:hypothetical protein [Kocuria dechangensis]GGG68675.1 hypothetical protein GCM10011374_36350 [Kocuria dechangensis]